MFKNNLNLAVLYGIFLLGISLFVLSIGAQFGIEYIERLEYNDDNYGHAQSYDLFTCISFMSIGLALVFITLAFLMRKKWARLVLLGILYLCILAWTIFLIAITGNLAEELTSILLGLSVMIYGLLIFSILFLNNEGVISQWSSGYVGVSEERNILDQI